MTHRSCRDVRVCQCVCVLCWSCGFVVTDLCPGPSLCSAAPGCCGPDTWTRLRGSARSCWRKSWPWVLPLWPCTHVGKLQINPSFWQTVWLFLGRGSKSVKSFTTKNELLSMRLTSACCRDNAPKQSSQRNLSLVRGTPKGAPSLHCRNRPVKRTDKCKRRAALPFGVSAEEPCLCAPRVMTRRKCPKVGKTRRRRLCQLLRGVWLL